MDMEEIWKPITGYEGYYEISNLGNIKSLDRYVLGKHGNQRFHSGRRMKANFSQPYTKVQLSLEGHVIAHYVHRLVATEFVPNPNGLPCVNHIDSDPRNNNRLNLEWVTYKDNTEHSMRCGSFTPKKHSAKLTDEEVRSIRVMYSTGEYSQRNLADIHGVTRPTIGNVLLGVTYKEVS